MTSLRRFPFALVALFAVVTLIAAFAYSINAWQVFGFARHVWRLPLALCFGAAVVADALSLAGLFATYLLRTAKMSVRAYAWVVFALMTSLSIAAAESFASWRTLPGNGGHVDPSLARSASVAAAAIVVALALATHLLIVAKRHASDVLAPSEPPVRKPPAKTPPPPAKSEGEAPKTERPERRETPPAPPPVSSGAGAQRTRRPRRGSAGAHTQEERDALARRVVAGERAVLVAKDAGVSKRSVENWTKAYRERKAAGQVDDFGAEVDALVREIESDHRPEVEVN